MQKTLKRVLCICAFLALLTVNFTSLTVQAKVTSKVKSQSTSTSRCLTKAMAALNNRAVKQMKADIAKAGKGHETAVRIYQEKLALVWSAMSEPYCGHGSRGVSAVKKSFLKSVARIRSEFMGAVKKQLNVPGSGKTPLSQVR